MPRTEEAERTGEGRRAHENEEQTIFEALHRDHRTVSGLMQQLEAESAGDPSQSRALFQALKNELLAHSYAEDEIVYELLVDSDNEELSDLIEDSREDHSAIEELLAELEEMNAAAEDWLAKLGSLRDMFERHVRREETTLFQLAEQEIDDDEQRDLAREFHTAKEQINFETGASGAEADESDEEIGGLARAADDGEIQDTDDLNEVRTGGFGEDEEIDDQPDSHSGYGRRGRNNRSIE
jgi:hypothetical protein